MSTYQSGVNKPSPLASSTTIFTNAMSGSQQNYLCKQNPSHFNREQAENSSLGGQNLPPSKMAATQSVIFSPRN
jgi:hypothetical protein